MPMLILGTKTRMINKQNSAYEADIKKHQWWQGMLSSYKNFEAGYKPSSKFRKPTVDWRRQVARGTLHTGRFYEGPSCEGKEHPSDYTPGNTRKLLPIILL
jgi:hypothetical protein